MRIETLPILFFLILFSLNSLSDDQEELDQLLDNYVKSVEDLDITLAKSIWSQKEGISFIQPRGHQKGWAEIEEAFYLDAMANFETRQLTLNNVNIRILSEDTAWSDFYWDFNAIFLDGSPIQSSGRETQIWQKEPDGWKIVHVHYSGVPVTGKREGF